MIIIFITRNCTALPAVLKANSSPWRFHKAPKLHVPIWIDGRLILISAINYILQYAMHCYKNWLLIQFLALFIGTILAAEEAVLLNISFSEKTGFSMNV
jgi:hypothetical protein